ncbi:MAG: hypothetical protein ACYC7A_04190 [Thermoanaerobaculia bacterium]
MSTAALSIEEALATWSREKGTGSPGAALDLRHAAESQLDDPVWGAAPWHDYLDTAGRPEFLTQLPDRAARERWTDTAFSARRSFAAPRSRSISPRSIHISSNSASTSSPLRR